jgi:hypothetical protein
MVLSNEKKFLIEIVQIFEKFQYSDGFFFEQNFNKPKFFIEVLDELGLFIYLFIEHQHR